jgi:hypothetical protein
VFHTFISNLILFKKKILLDLLMKKKRDTGTLMEKDSNAVVALNLIFQFLFQELKDTKTVRRYIVRKLSIEFQELIKNKTAGKLIKKLTARDFSLGNSFPVIHSIEVQTCQTDNSRRTIQELSVIVDLEYKNGFSLSVDADLILGRSAFIHIKIASIKGKARLQFTHTPFTHWSFTFIDDPQIDFAATSNFDGKNIPHLTTLILNQLRRSVKRKHTLPNYKCRFKPFFEPIYTQSLYKNNLEKFLLENGIETNTPTPSQSHSQSSTTTTSNPITNNEESLEAKRKSLETIKNKNSTNPSYRSLCSKLGYDLTSQGHLRIKLKSCDRLPDFLYSINSTLVDKTNNTEQNVATTTSAIQTVTTTTLPPTSTSTIESECPIYITISLDSDSMEELMSKQIYKEQWPLYEFKLNRTANLFDEMTPSLTSTNPINFGVIFIDIFFINKYEVVVQKVFPNSIAASQSNERNKIKKYDIIYSLNKTRISSVKQLNKLLGKVPPNAPLQFILQRPCVQSTGDLGNKFIPTIDTAMTSNQTNGQSSTQTNGVSNTKSLLSSSISSHLLSSISNTISNRKNTANTQSSSLTVDHDDSLKNPTDLSTTQSPKVSTTPTTTPISSDQNKQTTPTPGYRLPFSASNTSLLVSNTKQRFGRFEQKLRSLGSGGTTPTTPIPIPSQNNLSNSKPITKESTNPNPIEKSNSFSTLKDTNINLKLSYSSLTSLDVDEKTDKTNSTVPPRPPPPPPLPTPSEPSSTIPIINEPTSNTITDNQIAPPVVVTHSASASCLVDFFCAVSEQTVIDNSIESLEDFDLINMLSQRENQKIRKSKSSTNSSYNKTSIIKVNKEFIIQNKPITIDQTFMFDLNENTKFINIFLWTVAGQFSNKISKIRNLLIGYITVPLYEVSVDCYNTLKGETQSTIHFSPLEETKASSSSSISVTKLAKAHPLNDHLG